MCGVEIGEGEYAAIYDIKIYENEKRSFIVKFCVVLVLGLLAESVHIYLVFFNLYTAVVRHASPLS